MFFGLLGTQPPRYTGMGASQPRQSGGFLGLFSGLLGAKGTPAYAGKGQNSRSSAGFSLFARTPQYVQPPAEPEPALRTAAASVEKPNELEEAIAVCVISKSSAVDEGLLRELQDRVLDD